MVPHQGNPEQIMTYPHNYYITDGLMHSDTRCVMDVGQCVLQPVHRGQGDELQVHGLHRGHAPHTHPAGHTYPGTIMMMLEAAELTNWNKSS